MDEHVVSTIREYLAAYDAVQVAIFGSYARGEAGPTSDIDVLVEFGTKKSLFDIVEYELALGELVGRKIDLVTKPSLSLHFRDDVISRMHVIYGWRKNAERPRSPSTLRSRDKYLITKQRRWVTSTIKAERLIGFRLEISMSYTLAESRDCFLKWSSA